MMKINVTKTAPKSTPATTTPNPRLGHQPSERGGKGFGLQGVAHRRVPREPQTHNTPLLLPVDPDETVDISDDVGTIFGCARLCFFLFFFLLLDASEEGFDGVFADEEGAVTHFLLSFLVFGFEGGADSLQVSGSGPVDGVWSFPMDPHLARQRRNSRRVRSEENLKEMSSVIMFLAFSVLSWLVIEYGEDSTSGLALSRTVLLVPNFSIGVI